MPEEHPPLRLGVEIEGASTAFSIEDRWSPQMNGGSFVVQVLQFIGVRFQDTALESRANADLSAIQGLLAESLRGPDVGFLLEISLYTDEFGNVVIPSGQLVYPVGLGGEPVDALAEHLRQPQLRASPRLPLNLRNGTYHVWVTRAGGETIGRTIPSAFRERFVKVAASEARRRQMTARWEQSFPGDARRSVVRAAYWSEVATSRAVILQRKGAREEAEALTAEMRRLEQRTNALYKDYQRAEAALGRAQSHAATLEAIATIASFLKAGIEAGALISGPGETAVTGAQMAPEPNVPATREATAEVIQKQERVIRVITGPLLRHEIEMLRQQDEAMAQFYKKHDIPIPSRDPIKVPELP